MLGFHLEHLTKSWLQTQRECVCKGMKQFSSDLLTPTDSNYTVRRRHSMSPRCFFPRKWLRLQNTSDAYEQGFSEFARSLFVIMQWFPLLDIYILFFHRLDLILYFIIG